MNKPNQQDLEYLSKHMQGCQKREGWNVNAKRRVLIISDSNDAGKNMAKILQYVYPNTEVKDYSGGYRDFSLQFETVWQRDQAVTEINKMVSDYRSAHPGTSTSTDSSDEEELETISENEGSVKTLGGNLVYLVVGVVAVILIILLWNKKK